MALEIVVNQYFVTEAQTREIHDSPTIGLSRTFLIDKKEYGPYPSNIDAEKKIALLKLERFKGGWKESREDKNRLYDDNFDVFYNYKIRHDTAPF